MVILNFIILLLSSLASFIQNRKLAQYLISFLSFILILNNFYILYHPQSFFLGNFFGYVLEFKSEPFANIFVLMVTILNFCTNLYSFSYLKVQESSILAKDLKPTLHYFFNPLAIMATLAVAYSANLITLFIFYEVLTLVTYPLVVQPFTEKAFKAGRLYFTILFGSSLLILFTLIFIDQNFGILPFKLGGNLGENITAKEVLILLICFIFGFSKTAIFPLHLWLPKAMVAPIPVSALLHAVAVVKTGIFCLLKVFLYVFGLDLLTKVHDFSSISIEWISYLCCFTILFSSLIALFQKSIKEILAYSTICKLSYMILGITFLSKESILASFMLILTHSISKITLFFSTGIIYLSTYKLKIFELNGLAKKLPFTVMIFILAAFSVLGLPFSIGYKSISNFYTIIPQNQKITVICLFISSFLAAGYFYRIIYKMLAFNPQEEIVVLYNNPKALLYITVVTFSLSVLLLIFYNDIVLYLMRYLING